MTLQGAMCRRPVGLSDPAVVPEQAGVGACMRRYNDRAREQGREELFRNTSAFDRFGKALLAHWPHHF